jgi:hypothetical protein
MLPDIASSISDSVGCGLLTVRQRWRDMVNRKIAAHLHNYKATGAERQPT